MLPHLVAQREKNKSPDQNFHPHPPEYLITTLMIGVYLVFKDSFCYSGRLTGSGVLTADPNPPF